MNIDKFITLSKIVLENNNRIKNLENNFIFQDIGIERVKKKILKNLTDDSWIKVVNNNLYYEALKLKEYDEAKINSNVIERTENLQKIIDTYDLSSKKKIEYIKNELEVFIFKTEEAIENDKKKSHFSENTISKLYYYFISFKEISTIKNLNVTLDESKFIKNNFLEKLKIPNYLNLLKVSIYFDFLKNYLNVKNKRDGKIISQGVNNVFNLCKHKGVYSEKKRIMHLVEELFIILAKKELHYLVTKNDFFNIKTD